MPITVGCEALVHYLLRDEGWQCLPAVPSLYSRRVIGLAILERMAAKLVCYALTIAL
jgi:hypothetical protein